MKKNPYKKILPLKYKKLQKKIKNSLVTFLRNLIKKNGEALSIALKSQKFTQESFSTHLSNVSCLIYDNTYSKEQQSHFSQRMIF